MPSPASLRRSSAIPLPDQASARSGSLPSAALIIGGALAAGLLAAAGCGSLPEWKGGRADGLPGAGTDAGAAGNGRRAGTDFDDPWMRDAADAPWAGAGGRGRMGGRGAVLPPRVPVAPRRADPDDPADAPRGPVGGPLIIDPAEPPGAARPPGLPDRIEDPGKAAVAVRNRLDQPVERVIWPDIPWSDAVEFLSGETGLNIVPVWQVLEGEGLKRDRRVSLDAKGITGAQALDRLMELVGSGDATDNRPVWFIRGNVVVITTARGAAGR